MGEPGQNAFTFVAGFLQHINSHKRCLCLNYPKLFSGVSASDEVVIYGSEKLLFAGFTPAAGKSTAMWPEQENPSGMGDYLVSPWGFEGVFCPCLKHRQVR